MSIPKQVQVPNDREMKAPFNFVPLPEAPFIVYENNDDVPTQDIYDTNLFTGYIELQVTTETLLYTRCAYPPEYAGEQVHKCEERQHFFHHGDRQSPVIPGSSIRGMLRSLVEIIGYGKVTGENVFDEKLIYREVAGVSSLGYGYRNQMREDNVFAGYLHWQDNRRWIQPAEVHEGVTFGKVEKNPFAVNSDGMDVWCKPARKITSVLSGKTTQPADYVNGLLFESGKFGGEKKYYVVFAEDNTAQEVQIPDKIWHLWEDEINLNKSIPSRNVNQGKPVFYLLDDQQKSPNNSSGLVFFGPTRYFRLPYPYSTLEFVPEALRADKGLDLASAIFGSTKRRGRLRFSDALFTRTEDYDSPFLDNNRNGMIVPKILSSPKPTSFQEYLVQPMEAEDHPDVDDAKKLLLSYHHPYPKVKEMVIPGKRDDEIRVPTDGTVLRGYKQYWNKNNAKSEQLVSEENGWQKITNNTPQNTVIRPVRPGCSFESRIAFENLTKLELGVLLVALNLKDDKSRHRLGMAKPHGMGRVQITCQLHLEDRLQRYSSLTIQSYKQDSPKVGETVVKYFQAAILNHHQEKCGGSEAGSLWEIPRLKDLALLMKGTDHPECIYADFKTEKKLFIDRNVLPAPAQVCGDFVEKISAKKIVPPSPHNSQPQKTSHEVATPEKIQVGDCMTFIAVRKGNKWKFKVKESEGSGEGSLQAGAKLSENLCHGAEYQLTVVSSGNKKNKGMQLKWEK